MNAEEEDRVVLEWLRGNQSADTDEDLGNPVAGPRPRSDNVDDFLRGMGYDPRQRERLRRGQPRPRNEAKYRAPTVKRFEYHITQRLTDRTAEQIARLAAAWVGLTNYDLDLAQRWWAAGVDPGNPGQLASAIEAGLRVHDLGEVVKGRTIAEHLQAGSSLDWCVLALGWRHRQRSA